MSQPLRQKKYGYKRYHARKEAGICQHCPKAALSDSNYCAEHRDRAMEAQRRCQAKRRRRNPEFRSWHGNVKAEPTRRAA
jgi:hypothetical protein